jgi:hypothetical protein
VNDPAPFAAASSPESTEMAILDALPRRRWTAEDVQPGRIVAFLPIKSFLVRIEIAYDQSQVRIHYLNSDNLGEHPGPDGRTYVHGNVNKWLRALASDIRRALAAQPPAAPSAGGEATPAGAPAPLLGSALGAGGSAPAESAAKQPGGAKRAQPMATVPVAPH